MVSDSLPLHHQLTAWVEQGWLRDIDLALVQFLHGQAPEARDDALLAAALASHQLGRGHIYLDLARTLGHPDEALSLPPEGDSNSEGLALPSSLMSGWTLDGWEQSLRQSGFVSMGTERVDGASTQSLPGAAENDNRPLVMDRGRLYLRRYWQYEQQVARAIRSRLEQAVTGDDRDLSRVVETLFQPLRGTEELPGTGVHWQTIAAALAARSRFTIISGGPGTGKTTTVVRVLGVLQQLALDAGSRPLRIHLAAPTGKAAARLTESIGAAVDQLPEDVRPLIPLTVTTLHRLLRPKPFSRKFRHDAGNPLHLDLLVVDEASMVDLELMAALLDALHPSTRLILLGDKDQLASVEAGAVLGELCQGADQPGYSQNLVRWLYDCTGYDLAPWQAKQAALAAGKRVIDDHIALLRKSHRFGANSGIGQLAEAINRQDASRAMKLIQQGGFSDVAWIATRAPDGVETALLRELILEGAATRFSHPDESGGYKAYLDIIHQGPESYDSFDGWTRAVLAAFGRFQVLSALRKGPFGVESLNVEIEKILREVRLIGGAGAWYAGRPVLVTRNDYSLGLMNGDVGIALPDPESGDHLRVCFQAADGAVRKVLTSRLVSVETVFAMTVHKSQGSEFNHTCLVLPDRVSPILTKELLYTGITRARDRFSLVVADRRVFQAAVERRTQRASALAERLAEPFRVPGEG